MDMEEESDIRDVSTGDLTPNIPKYIQQIIQRKSQSSDVYLWLIFHTHINCQHRLLIWECLLLQVVCTSCIVIQLWPNTAGWLPNIYGNAATISFGHILTRTKDRWSCIGLGLFRFQDLADYSRWIPHKSWLPILPSHFHWSQSIPSRYFHSMCPDHSDRPQNHLILSSISTFNCMYSPSPAERQLESGLLPLCDSHHLSSDMLLNVAKCSHHEYQQIQAESADHHHKLSEFMSYCSAPLQSR